MKASALIRKALLDAGGAGLSYQQIAERAGCSRRMAQMVIRWLHAEGHLVFQEAALGETGRKSKLWSLRPEAVEQVAGEAEKMAAEEETKRRRRLRIFELWCTSDLTQQEIAERLRASLWLVNTTIREMLDMQPGEVLPPTTKLVDRRDVTGKDFGNPTPFNAGRME